MIELLIIGFNLIFVLMTIFFVCTIRLHGNAVITTLFLFGISVILSIFAISLIYEAYRINAVSIIVALFMFLLTLEWDSDIKLWDMIFIVPKALFYKEYRMLLDNSHITRWDHRGYRYDPDDYSKTVKILPKVISKYLNKEYCDEQELMVLKGLIPNNTNNNYLQILKDIKLYIDEQTIILNKMKCFN